MLFLLCITKLCYTYVQRRNCSRRIQLCIVLVLKKKKMNKVCMFRNIIRHVCLNNTCGCATHRCWVYHQFWHLNIHSVCNKLYARYLCDACITYIHYRSKCIINKECINCYTNVLNKYLQLFSYIMSVMKIETDISDTALVVIY